MAFLTVVGEQLSLASCLVGVMCSPATSACSWWRLNQLRHIHTTGHTGSCLWVQAGLMPAAARGAPFAPSAL
jgi:hypothetical protein